jgi:hypothetical protein
MKAARSAKAIEASRRNITIIRENVPVMALAGIAFGGSYGHIVQLFGDYGLHGWDKYAAAATVDLLCIIGAEERQRDKRIGRVRGWGFVSWPMIVLIIGICATLAANLATAVPGVLGYCAAGWSAVALLLAVSVLERRTSSGAVPETASTKTAPRKRDRETGSGTADEYQAAGPGGTGETARQAGERTFAELLAEARAYREERAAAGERTPTKDRLRLRLGVGSSKALDLLQALKEDETREEAI